MARNGAAFAYWLGFVTLDAPFARDGMGLE